MEDKQIISMANQIGDFFQAYPKKNEGIEGVASHITKFWSPKMRVQLKKIIAEGSNDDLKIIVLDASKLI